MSPLKQHISKNMIGIIVIPLSFFVANGCTYKNKTINSNSSADFIMDVSVVIDSNSVRWLDVPSSILLSFHYGGLNLEASGTALGAIVKYNNTRIFHNESLYRMLLDNNDDTLVVNLSMDEWSVFLKRLYYSGIREWEKVPDGTPLHINALSECCYWELDIYTKDSDTLVESRAWDEYPSNWLQFQKLMYDFIRNIIKVPLDSVHQKNFGTPISDFENSIMSVYFEGTTVIKTMSGVIKATNASEHDIFFNLDNWLSLNTSKWLDIIHALGDGVCKSSEFYGTEKSEIGKARVELITEYFDISKKNLPVFEELKKIIDEINTLIKKGIVIEK